MSSLLIYIEDQLLILKSGTKIAYNYQNTFLSDLGKRFASYSNQITAPFCPENDLIFGFARFEKSQAKPAYRLLRSRVIRNGVEIPLSTCSVESCDEGYRLNFYDGTVFVFDSIGDKTIDALKNINPTLLTWNDSALDTFRNADDSIVTPFINYGQVTKERLINGDLDGLTGWEQIQTNAKQEYFVAGVGYIYAQIQSWANTLTSFDGETTMFRQKYKFSSGQEYTITLRSNYVTQPAYVKVFLIKETGETLEVISAVNSAATDDTVTLTVSSDYEYVGIYGILPAPTPTNTITSIVEVHDISISLSLKVKTPYLPSVYYHKIITSIYENSGFNLTDEAILEDETFLNLVLPFSKERFEYTGFFNTCREFEANVGNAVNVNGTSANIPFTDLVKKDLFGFFNPTTGVYDTNSPYEPVETYDSRSFYAKFFCALDIILISGSIDIYLESQGYGVMDSINISSVGRHRVFLAANEFDGDNNGFNIVVGDIVRINLDATSGNATVISGSFLNNVNGINQEQTTPVFYPCEILPKIKAKDFLKDFYIRFAIVPYEFRGNISLKTISEIIADKSNSLDWTNKRDKSIDDKVIFNRRYAKKNYLSYPSNDDIFNPVFSTGSIDVDNETLEPESTIYESIFNGSMDMSIDASGNSIYFGHVPIYDAAPDFYPTPDLNQFARSPGNRLMIVRSKKSSEPTIEYNGNDRSDYLIGNFFNPNDNVLGMGGFIDRYYYGALNSIRNDKGVIRNYILTDEDVARINPHTLVYDNGSYFWVEKIINHDPSLSTKVQLFKID